MRVSVSARPDTGGANTAVDPCPRCSRPNTMQLCFLLGYSDLRPFAFCPVFHLSVLLSSVRTAVRVRASKCSSNAAQQPTSCSTEIQVQHAAGLTVPG